MILQQKYLCADGSAHSNGPLHQKGWRPDPCPFRRHGVEALRQMRENRVRSVLVIDDDVLVGIVTQGDCAIKVLLPGLDAKQTPVGQVMTGNPVTVEPDHRLESCMAMMAARGFRHLPVLDAGKVVGVVSIGDIVRDIIRDLEHNVGDLMGYIMRDGPGG
jgi:signal-transduction protein with cAMP-binding, CBS, and nucleotidyltransferase domain